MRLVEDHHEANVFIFVGWKQVPAHAAPIHFVIHVTSCSFWLLTWRCHFALMYVGKSKRDLQSSGKKSPNYVFCIKKSLLLAVWERDVTHIRRWFPVPVRLFLWFSEQLCVLGLAGRDMGKLSAIINVADVLISKLLILLSLCIPLPPFLSSLVLKSKPVTFKTY